MTYEKFDGNICWYSANANSNWGLFFRQKLYNLRQGSLYYQSKQCTIVREIPSQLAYKFIYIFLGFPPKKNGSHFSWPPGLTQATQSWVILTRCLGFRSWKSARNLGCRSRRSSRRSPSVARDSSEVSICHGHKLYVWNRQWMEGGAHWLHNPQEAIGNENDHHQKYMWIPSSNWKLGWVS